jgi:peptide/nickel transport system permease protein
MSPRGPRLLARAPLFSPPWPALWPALWFGAAALAWRADLSHRLDHALAPGFDAFGRALLPLTLKASLVSAAFAGAAVAASVLFAALAGCALALSRGAPRFYGLRALDLTLAFPSLLFALAWAAVSGPGWDTLLASLALGTVPGLTRLVFARARELLREEYVLAARSLGARPARVILRHLLPGVWSLCRVKVPNLFAGALLAEATLSFLGVGAPIGRDTWGSLLAQGRDYLIEAPHIALFAGIPLVMTVLSLQLLSERLARRHSRAIY